MTNNKSLNYIYIHTSQYKYGILLLLSLILALFLRIRLEDPPFYDDPFIYFSRAVEIYESGNYSPMQYPMGYSLILASSFYLLGLNIHAAHLITAIISSFIVFPIYYIAKEIFTKKNAIISAFLIAIDPLHILISAGLWSDTSAILLLTSSVYFLIRYSKLDNSSDIYIFTMLVAVASLVRYTSAIFLIVAFIYISFSKKNILYYIKRKDFYISILIYIIILIPQLIYNTTHFGGPFTAGYMAHHDLFSWRYLFETPPAGDSPTIMAYAYAILLWTFDFNSPIHIFGKSTFLPPLLTLFSIIGILVLYKRKEFLILSLLLLWIVFPVIPHLFLLNSKLWQVSRYLLIIHPPFIIIGVYAIFELIENLTKKISSITNLRRNLAGAILIIVVILLIFIPMIINSLLVKPPSEDSIGREIQKQLESYANKYVIFSVERHEAFKDSLTWIKAHRLNNTLIIGSGSFKDEFYAGKIYPINSTNEELKEQIENANESYIIIYVRDDDSPIDVPENIKLLIKSYNFSLIKSFNTNFRGEKWNIYHRSS